MSRLTTINKITSLLYDCDSDTLLAIYKAVSKIMYNRRDTNEFERIGETKN